MTIKIAFVTTHYPPSSGFGGVTESGYQLSRALASLGVQVSVLTSDAKLGGRVPAEDFKTVEEKNVRVYPYRYFVNAKSAPSLDGFRFINKVAAESDLVHINGIYTFPVTVAAWCAQRCQKPHIVALRNGLDPYMFEIRRFKKLLGFRLYVKPILNHADAIHATAAQEVEHARSFGVQGDFLVIPNGIDSVDPEKLPAVGYADDFWPQLRFKRIVLFLSRLSPQKGLDMLIPAWAAIRKTIDDAILVIAGPDYQGYASFVHQLVDRHGVRDSVLLTGEVNGDRKWALYNSAELFVLPSYSENFGNVIAEALAFKVPVLTTTATPWTVLEKYDCGMCVPPTRQEIEFALRRLLSMPRTYLKKMGAASHELLAHVNSWQQSAQQFVDAYEKILSKQPVSVS